MSRVGTKQNSCEVLTSIIKSLANIPAFDAVTSDQTHATNQASSFSGRVAQLEQHQQSQVKNIFLTLHFLFPHELLPALDLLDRKLITSFYISISDLKEDSALPANVHSRRNPNDQSSLAQVPRAQMLFRYYYVQSASAVAHTPSTSSTTGSTSRYRNAFSTVGTYYEVNIDSWNCTCPAFAFSSMKLLMSTSFDSGTQVSSAQKIRAHLQSGKVTIGPVHNHDEDVMENDCVRSDHIEDKGQDWQFGGTAINTDGVVPICKHVLAVVLANGIPNLFHSSVQSTEVTREEIAGRAAGYGTK